MILLFTLWLEMGKLLGCSVQEVLPEAIKNAETVSFCTIANNTSAYNGKIVRVKAILVQNHKVRVDGGDPYYYDPTCLGGQNYAYADFRQSNDPLAPPPKLFDSKRARAKKDKYGSTRNSVLLVARVTYVQGKGYGHLDWARFQFTELRTEEFGAVKKNILWPYSKR
jgi:hypothetical protein